MRTQSSRCLDQSGPDEDHDGISDACELELARKFAPLLTYSRGSCNLASDSQPLLPAGGHLFGVQPVGSTIRVAYLPAYVDDCGWEGPKCKIPTVDCRGHSGDSEFIVVELRRRGSDTLSISGVFLSAHCFGLSADDCRWYRNDELDGFEWRESSPVIWVAKGRNANYRSRSACERGHHFLDTCDEATVRLPFPVRPDRNIGSRQRPAFDKGCIEAGHLGLEVANRDAVECIWDPNTSFHGWQSGTAGVTGYYRYLTDVAGF